MSAFLLLFSGYREAIAENARLQTENARLQGEASAAEGRAEATERRVEDLQRVVDSYSFQATRRYVFQKAEAPVVGPVEVPVSRGRRLMRDVAAELTREAQKKQREFLHSQFQTEAAPEQTA
jgi:hypothetical protein